MSFSFCRYQKCCLLGMEAKLVMSKTKIEDKRKGQKGKRSKEATVTSDSTDELIEVIEVIDLSDEVKDIHDADSLIHKLDKCCRRLQAEKEDLRLALLEAESALKQEELKVRKAAVDIGQVHRDFDHHIKEKKDEFDNIRKSHQHEMDSLGACLEAEQCAKEEVFCIKKKLEDDIKKLEIALNKANKANAEAQKTIKQYQDQLGDAVQEEVCDLNEVHEAEEEAHKDMFDYLGYFLGQKVGLQKQSFCHKSVDKRVKKTKKRDKPEELEVNSLDIQDLKGSPRSFLKVTTLANGESSMSALPFTNEEMGFCSDLKQTKMDAWKSHPVPLEVFQAMISKQVHEPKDASLQRSNEVFSERFVILFNNLNLFKSLDENDRFTLLSSNLHFSLIILSAYWFHPKHSGTAQVNMYLHGDPESVQQNSSYNRIEMEELMPWCCGSHPMHQILQTVMQIDMDEVIFMLLVTITLLNSKIIKFRRIQDHLKLKLFRYLKHKCCQSEAVKQFHIIEQVIHTLLYSKDFYALLQE